MKNFIKKASMSTFANFFVLIVSIFSTLVFPKVLSVSDYSYWQLYVFYTSYVTIAGFGIIEGVYLTYGGKDYEELDNSVLSFCTYFLSVLLPIIFLALYIVSLFVVKNDMTKLVILFTCINGIIFNIRVFPLFVFQATNKIKEFATALIIGRLVFLIISIVGIKYSNSLLLFMIADNVGCLICSIYSYYKTKNKLLTKPTNYRNGIVHIKKFIKSGINLLIASLISAAILGVIKYFIKDSWDIIEFGKISLILTFTNVFLKFATSIGQVLFPLLCNFKKEHSKKIYDLLIGIINLLIVLLFIFYYPVQKILLLYLPNYAESIKYMSFLLPICLYETQVALVFNTYYKSLRKEKELMRINVIVFILSFLTSFIFAKVLNNLFLSIFSILIILFIRSTILEKYLSRKVLNVDKDYSFDSFLISLVFIICNALINGVVGFIVYTLFALIYIILNKNTIKKVISLLKSK